VSQNVFADEWRDCLRAHYMHVVRTEDHVTLPTLTVVMHQAGFNDSELAELRVRATLRTEQVANDFVPQLDVLADAPDDAPYLIAVPDMPIEADDDLLTVPDMPIEADDDLPLTDMPIETDDDLLTVPDMPIEADDDLPLTDMPIEADDDLLTVPDMPIEADDDLPLTDEDAALANHEPDEENIPPEPAEPEEPPPDPDAPQQLSLF
jgi:hypothetical protein